ncbi:MAG TPA: hypothetical protein VF418_08720 [Sphingomonadaceae bacterium]
MSLPKIELSELPDLTQPIGIFGSIQHTQADDSMVILMSYIFEISPPPGHGR